MGDIPVVITGFRSPAEIQGFIDQYSGSLRVSAIYLSANARLRFERCKARDREDAPHTLDDFIHRDDLQRKMGLDAIQKDNGIREIKNEGTIKALQSGIIDVCGLKHIDLSRPKEVTISSEARLEERILCALHTTQEYLTTTEIARHIAEGERGRRLHGSGIVGGLRLRVKLVIQKECRADGERVDDQQSEPRKDGGK